LPAEIFQSPASAPLCVLSTQFFSDASPFENVCAHATAGSVESPVQSRSAAKGGKKREKKERKKRFFLFFFFCLTSCVHLRGVCIRTHLLKVNRRLCGGNQQTQRKKHLKFDSFAP